MCRCDSDFIERLIDAFGNNLKYLTVGSIEFNLISSTDFSDIDFGQLTELKIINETCSKTMNILQTAINLRKVSIDLRYTDAHTAISQIMKCKNLEYLHVVAISEYISYVFREIRRGLANMIKVNKTMIKIRVRVEQYGSYKLSLWMLAPEVMKTVKSMRILQDFILIIELNCLLGDPYPNWQMKSATSNVKVVTFENCHAFMSEHNTICGWNEKWIGFDE